MTFLNNGEVDDTTAPSAFPYGILSPATNVIEDNDDRWLRGFVYPTTDDGAALDLLPFAGNPTSWEAEHAIVAGDSPIAYRQYYPFGVKASMSASTMGQNPDELLRDASAVLDTVTQKAIEIEFWKGIIARKLQAADASKGTRYLGGTEGEDFIDVTPSGATGGVKPRYAQALLEQALADSTIGSRGTLHIPPLLASILKLKDDKGVLRTNLGTSAVVGAGYSTTGPDGQPVADGKAWMYATGPVTVRLGRINVTPTTPAEAVDTTVNTIKYFIDRPAAVTWSTAKLHAVLVDLSLDYA